MVRLPEVIIFSIKTLPYDKVKFKGRVKIKNKYY